MIGNVQKTDGSGKWGLLVSSVDQCDTRSAETAT
jgi:hypothetical protein